MKGDFLALVPSSHTSLIVGSTFLTTLALLSLAKSTLSPVPRKIIPSPRDSLLPSLSKEEQEALPYPPDIFPGARDVESPVRDSKPPKVSPPLTRTVWNNKSLRMGSRERPKSPPYPRNIHPLCLPGFPLSRPCGREKMQSHAS